MNKDFTLRELIELYKEFKVFWFETQPVKDLGSGFQGRLKPDFFDFMEWLIKK